MNTTTKRVNTMFRKTHTMVDRYRARELDKEIVPSLSLGDAVFICAYFAVTRLGMGFVIRKLQIPYLVFNLAVAVWLTRKVGNANYPKRLYHTIWYKMAKTRQDTVYLPIESKKEML